MAILITGGAGYIGSHTVLCLLEKGFEVVVLDNHCNSSYEALKRVKKITGKELAYYNGDVGDEALLDDIFLTNNINTVIHFAGLKSVSESIEQPLKYYENNVQASIVLLDKMIEHGILNFIFSSSATVYGEPEFIPLTESCSVGGTTNPYGTSKLMVEQILRDVANAYEKLNITILRYFNPVGAHSSGEIGEDPAGIPCNLVPFITQVALGKLPLLSVYGGDYPTHDGTGVRDYIHVMDLAEGHVAAIESRQNQKFDDNKVKIYNLGTGAGYSVLDLINAFERQSGKKINYKIKSRRSGDIAECWSNPKLAMDELNWCAKRGLDEMMRDSWNWQQKNPDGYKSTQ
ncbi:UDP-glucose 4-epimerase GalE [Pluralibacter gergoviae]|uniref:UDP-glucose 4-epimerase GalE n=1 Tax=Pluralibacter gergoviae TaxID=61647 RepID=UPI00330F204B|nr:UDP-glucose 4-epimerase GalE [Pluralibacter gergoviae]